MLKKRLLALNPMCTPRVRSTSGRDGRNVRFNCKLAPHNCSLNVSAIKHINGSVSYLKPSGNTYVAGSCANVPTCCTCLSTLSGPDDIDIGCDGPHRHHYCKPCFNKIVHMQVLGDGRPAFLLSQEVMCTGCIPPTPIPLHPRAQHLDAGTWSSYLTACSDVAVVKEQQRMQALMNKMVPAAPLSPTEQAMETIRGLVLPLCPTCKTVVPDFEACAAITCGAISISREGAHGCGTRLCGWCLCVCSIYDHSSHVSHCHLNPRPGHSFPESVAAWKRVQHRAARDRIYKFVSTLPKGVSSEVFALVHKEFPHLPGFDTSKPSVVAVEDAGEARTLRASPAQPQPHFIANIQRLEDMGLATRAVATRTLEACGNDLQIAVSLLLDTAQQ